MLLRRGYLDREMIWDTFSYYARFWWSACRDYVTQERANLTDETLFTDFDHLAEKISEYEAKKKRVTRVQLEPSGSQVKDFLEAEASL